MVCSRFGGEVLCVLPPVKEVSFGEILAHLAYFSAVTTINTEDPTYFSTETRTDHQSTSEASYTEVMRQPGHHINSTRQKGKRSSTLFDTNAMGLKAIGRLQGATISFGREGTQVGSYKQEVNQTS